LDHTLYTPYGYYKELGIKLPLAVITNHYENTPTIQLIDKKASKLDYKLRHVDINNYLIRHNISRGFIRENQRKTGEDLE
jgi:hypothetical protein